MCLTTGQPVLRRARSQADDLVTHNPVYSAVRWFDEEEIHIINSGSTSTQTNNAITEPSTSATNPQSERFTNLQLQPETPASVPSTSGHRSTTSFVTSNLADRLRQDDCHSAGRTRTIARRSATNPQSERFANLQLQPETPASVPSTSGHRSTSVVTSNLADRSRQDDFHSAGRTRTIARRS